MPETAESLSYDNKGKCSVCEQIDYKKNNIDWSKRLSNLKQIVSDHKGKNDYDCIVPFSGGKDSTFTLYYLVKKLGLKCLVVRFDHLFMRPTVEENAMKTFAKLGVDVIKFSPNLKVVKMLMFESLFRRGDFCWHCHTGIFAYPMWVALNYNVQLIFWGEPGSEYSSFYGYDELEEADERRFNRKINLGINAEDMVGMINSRFNDANIELRDLKPFTFPPQITLNEKKIKSVMLGYYIHWDVKEQVKLIKKELDWIGDTVEGVPPEYDYEKIECYMQGMRDYIKYLKRGFGRTAHLTSIDIRNERLDRETALDLCKKFDGKKPVVLEIFLKTLKISEEEFMNIVSRHVVEPFEMPNKKDIKRSNLLLDGLKDFEKKIL
tara:strand:- start:5722 stop:6855 length:1134 start_codon:yes stop_codon:yes gene_type:complete